ncbi:MAG: hypothetical protein ACLUVY_05550 [Bacteroides uniformis]
MHRTQRRQGGKGTGRLSTRIEGIAPGTNDLLDGCLRNAQKAGPRSSWG